MFLYSVAVEGLQYVQVAFAAQYGAFPLVTSKFLAFQGSVPLVDLQGSLSKSIRIVEIWYRKLPCGNCCNIQFVGHQSDSFAREQDTVNRTINNNKIKRPSKITSYFLLLKLWYSCRNGCCHLQMMTAGNYFSPMEGLQSFSDVCV